MSKTLKNYRSLIISGFVALTAISISISAIAASSGSVVISGVVSLINSITITAFGANNTTLDILAGASNYKVATFSLSSNNTNGYKIQMKSTNGGKLNHSSSSAFLTYTVKFGTFTTTAPGSSYADIGSPSGTLSGLTNDAGDILVTFTGNSNALAGTYSDEVFFQIVAL